MNPILKECINNIKKHIELTQGEEMFLIIEIGKTMCNVAYSCTVNPNFNLKGGNYIDENSYAVKNKSLDLFNNFEL